MEMSKILSCILVLVVENLKESLAFFIDKMGFRLEDSYGNPIYYAKVSRDSTAEISLLKQPNFVKNQAVVATLVFQCLNIDHLYQEFIDKGIAMEAEIGNKEYKKREFSLKDPNGYVFFFQQDIK